MANLSWKKFFSPINKWYRDEPSSKPLTTRLKNWASNTFDWGKFWVKHFCAPTQDPVTQAKRDIYMREQAAARRSTSKNRSIKAALKPGGNSHAAMKEQLFYQTHLDKRKEQLDALLDKCVNHIYDANPFLQAPSNAPPGKDADYVKRAIKLYCKKRIDWEKIPGNHGKFYPHPFPDPYTEYWAVIDQRPEIQGLNIPMPTWWNTIGLRAINPLSWLDLIVGNAALTYGRFNALIINKVLGGIGSLINCFRKDPIDAKNSIFGKILKGIFVAPLVAGKTFTYLLSMITSGTGGLNEMKHFINELDDMTTSHNDKVAQIRQQTYNDAVEESRLERKATLDVDTIRDRERKKAEIEISVHRRSEIFMKNRLQQTVSHSHIRASEPLTTELNEQLTDRPALDSPRHVQPATPNIQLMISPRIDYRLDSPNPTQRSLELPSPVPSDRTAHSYSGSPLDTSRGEISSRSHHLNAPPGSPVMTEENNSPSTHETSRGRRRRDRALRTTPLATIQSQVELDVTRLGLFADTPPAAPQLTRAEIREQMRGVLRRSGSDIVVNGNKMMVGSGA